MKIDDSLESLIEKYRITLAKSGPGNSQTKPERLVLSENRITFTVPETAVFLGISPRSVDRAIKRGEIQAKRLGRRWLIPKTAIESWLNRKD